MSGDARAGIGPRLSFRWRTGLAVLSLHLVAVWWWAHSIPSRPSAALRYSTVRLLPLEQPRPSPVDATVRLPPNTMPPAAARRTGRRSAAPTLPTPPARTDTRERPVGSDLAAVPAAAASAASQPEPRPLDLVLRPGFRSRSGMPEAGSDDRRLLALPLTPEQRMTQTLGTAAARSEEVLADGTRRIREGGRCVLVRPNRAATLFPFEASAARLPRAVDRCD